MPEETRHRVVIVGGGFGGLAAAKNLKTTPVHVTLVDRRNFHLFQPLLYQVATGILSPGEITAPLRHILRKQKNATVLLAETVDFDPANHCVTLADGVVEYDTLIVAVGMKNYYFGHDSWRKIAPGLKSIEDSGSIRQKIFFAFEVAEREANPEKQQAWLTFVVVGSGPTGVELTGMLAEIARDTLRDDFRSFRPEDSKILLVDAADRILPSFPPELSKKARKSLEELGVIIQTGMTVKAIDDEGVTLQSTNGTQRVASRTVLWAAGVSASPMGQKLAEKTGAPLDRLGRIRVNPDLTLPGHPEILVIGDMAHFPGRDGNPLPGLAPVATQQGRYAARLIRKRLAGPDGIKPFVYFDKGAMAVIGRNAAVADIGPLHFGGVAAWLIWLFIHLLLLVTFESRMVVFIRWAFSYFTYSRGSRLLISTETLCMPVTGAAVEERGPILPGTVRRPRTER